MGADVKEANFRRKILTERNYLQYRDDIKVSERTKDIAADYVAGMSYKELAEKYDSNPKAIANNIVTYIGAVSKMLRIRNEKLEKISEDNS